MKGLEKIIEREWKRSWTEEEFIGETLNELSRRGLTVENLSGGMYISKQKESFILKYHYPKEWRLLKILIK